MAIYLNQINKRRAAERAARAEVIEKTNNDSDATAGSALCRRMTKAR